MRGDNGFENQPLSFSLQSVPSPTMKGDNDFENQPLSGFLQSVPSPCGRGLGRGQNLKIRRIVFSAGKASGK
ncbi:hypothetical protein NEILACOT_04236 [Neisseria lactamica ATCC 23970]|uniref:Uncharacterized protein n=1 Tax=Neisseria lactamica ATCC 23970 TaxID=546265 RepID=D0W9M4_NEILA|nr:hypothetical protein NEILACOT_04236 [Neisseria lactamica ATCC 23970]